MCVSQRNFRSYRLLKCLIDLHVICLSIMFNSSDPTGDDYETYLYDDIDPGWSIYTPGNELALRFESDSIDHGFQIVYYQADPGDKVYTML